MRVKYKANIGAIRVHHDIMESVEEILSNSHSVEYPDYYHSGEYQQMSEAVYSFILTLIERGLIDEEWEEGVIIYTDDYVSSRTVTPRKPTPPNLIPEDEKDVK